MVEIAELAADPARLQAFLRRLQSGFMTSIGDVTLTLSSATTLVKRNGVSVNSAVILTPLDATTALEYGLGTTWVVPASGQFTINHPSNANTRKYRWVYFYG